MLAASLAFNLSSNVMLLPVVRIVLVVLLGPEALSLGAGEDSLLSLRTCSPEALRAVCEMASCSTASRPSSRRFRRLEKFENIAHWATHTTAYSWPRVLRFSELRGWRELLAVRIWTERQIDPRRTNPTSFRPLRLQRYAQSNYIEESRRLPVQRPSGP